MQVHVDPSDVLLVSCLVGIPGALLQERINNLMVDMLLLEHLLVRELDLAVKVLKSCGLAKAQELVVDEAILEVVKLVNVLHHFLTLNLYKVLDKRISANGNPDPVNAAHFRSYKDWVRVIGARAAAGMGGGTVPQTPQ
jgi:hypothetical protein